MLLNTSINKNIFSGYLSKECWFNDQQDASVQWKVIFCTDNHIHQIYRSATEYRSPQRTQNKLIIFQIIFKHSKLEIRVYLHQHLLCYDVATRYITTRFADILTVQHRIHDTLIYYEGCITLLKITESGVSRYSDHPRQSRFSNSLSLQLLLDDWLTTLLRPQHSFPRTTYEQQMSVQI